MLLAIDVGNTHTVIGLYEGESLVRDWRITTSGEQTTDELCMLYRVLLDGEGKKPADVTGVAVSSVVPALTAEYRNIGLRLFDCQTLVVDHTTVGGLRILNHDPASVGPDRLVNAVAARAIYGTPAVVVDLGTATTLDVVDTEGNYAGGVIVPGLTTAAESLFRRGARLARVEILRPERIVGRSTEESIQAGVFYGAVEAIDGIVRRIFSELSFPADAAVIATGGLAESVASASQTVTEVDAALTLTGIRMVWDQQARGS